MKTNNKETAINEKAASMTIRQMRRKIQALTNERNSWRNRYMDLKCDIEDMNALVTSLM